MVECKSRPRQNSKGQALPIENHVLTKLCRCIKVIQSKFPSLHSLPWTDSISPFSCGISTCCHFCSVLLSYPSPKLIYKINSMQWTTERGIGITQDEWFRNQHRSWPYMHSFNVAVSNCQLHSLPRLLCTGLSSSGHICHTQNAGLKRTGASKLHYQRALTLLRTTTVTHCHQAYCWAGATSRPPYPNRLSS